MKIVGQPPEEDPIPPGAIHRVTSEPLTLTQMSQLMISNNMANSGHESHLSIFTIQLRGCDLPTTKHSAVGLLICTVIFTIALAPNGVNTTVNKLNILELQV